ncbi:unnamed protein product [Effrenium voratum]|nr:unnamed protein product [Effrenium voratum]
MRHVHRAVETKALEALAVGNLPPGRELELISALDLGTVPWSQLPIRFKERLGLPLQDRGIDSLALNLSVAVQAKDYQDKVPLRRLATFHLLVTAQGSPLRDKVEQMIVASNESTRLPQEWQWTGATHRKYTRKEINMWRARARNQTFATDEEQPKVSKMKRWPHQVHCFKACQAFLSNSSAKHDFFVQMATGTGKSLVMADLLAELGHEQRACIIVPKLDLMEQMAQLLEETLPDRKVCRVGTGWPADLTAEVLVCVRNSAWQLQRLSFDMVILDEAHHYEPMFRAPNWSESDADVAADNLTYNDLLGVHAKQVLALQTRKRVFFSATLVQNEPDFDFDLRPAIQAGVIMDYTVMVPLVSEGDLRPALVKVIHNLPLARKILAFCNTVREAQSFAHMLNDAGIPADHYNAKTVAGQRQDILRGFRRSQAHGGIRVLVTVDVLSEGVDLPVADTCLFVAPRRGVRLRQCVGRVLRKHPGKVDALVIAPPIVQKSDGSLAEEAELKRLLSELAMADPCFRDSLTASVGEKQGRVGILAGRMQSNELHEELATEAASLLGMRVFPHVLEACSASFAWEAALQELARYKLEHGNVHVRSRFVTDTGLKLGLWVSTRRRDRSNGKLSAEQIASLDELGFVWDVLDQMWQKGLEQLKQYREEHGHVLVPTKFKTTDGFKLGSWVSSRRTAMSKGKLCTEQVASLDELGFVWDVLNQMWQQGLEQLQERQLQGGQERQLLRPAAWLIGRQGRLGQILVNVVIRPGRAGAQPGALGCALALISPQMQSSWFPLPRANGHSTAVCTLRRLVELEQMGRVKRQILGMVTQAVVTDMPDLFEGRSGRTCMRQLLDFYKFATDHTASRPDFWGFYAHLQEAAGDDKAALESRLRQGRALQARLWDENDPETFSEYLQELLECFDLVDQTMDDPRTKDIAKAESPAFSSTVAEAAKKLRDKLELTVQEPQWKPAVGKLAALAQKAERRCASPAASRFQLGARLHLGDAADFFERRRFQAGNWRGPALLVYRRGLMSTNSLVLSEAGDEARHRMDRPDGERSALPSRSQGFLSPFASGDGSRGRPFFMGDPIKVCVRVRPLSASATEDNEIVCVRVPPADSPDKIPNTVMLMHNRSHAKTYNFDRVYWSVKPTDSHYVSQERLMEDLGGELRDNVIGGYHSCLFAYGQTGSGKTYTVLGNDSSPEQRGLLPRIVQEIFENISELKSPSNEVTVTISYLEIYNEQIRDLLVTSEDTRWKLEDWPNMKAWLDFGVKATSSRSHCIFTMELIQKQWSGGTCNQLRSKLSVVDLAGSERQKKTQATGSRLKEGAMINQSLHNLSLVISRLAEPMKAKEQKRNPDFIPFRQSKLTFLMLEDCLRGNSKTVLIAALSPAGFNFDETMSTLQFAQNAKAVKTNAKKNENLEETLMKELEAECARLRKLVSTDAGAKASSRSSRRWRRCRGSMAATSRSN